MALLTAIKAFMKKPDPLAEPKARLNRQVRRINELRVRNRLSVTAGYLERLEQMGEQFYKPPTPPREEPRTRTVPVLSYVKDEKTAYPFASRLDFATIRHEQDPLFGWCADPFNPFGGMYAWGNGAPVNAFPREMFPDRPSSLRTQIAQDAIRLMSRLWYETVPQYAGIVSHLRNYVVGEGMVVNVTSDQDEMLAKDIKAWIEEFAKHKFNKLPKRVRDSALNVYRDGEDALQLVQKPGEDYPRIRSVDTSWIRGPHNELNGPWGFGVLTDWPRDYDEVFAFHLWYPDNSHEDVSPSLFKLAKLDTTGSNVKRGVPLAYKIRKQLPQLGTLLDAMAVGEAARQSIPYIQQYALADKSAVRESLPSVFDEDDCPVGFGPTPNGSEIRPGEVQHINKGQEFVNPPSGYANQGRDAYQSLCEACAAACTVPIWFAMGGSDKENYASAFVKESPLVKNIQNAQSILTDHYQEFIGSAVQIAVDKGVFPVNSLDICNIHCELPTPIARDKYKDLEADLLMVDKGLLSPQDCCTRNGLEFDEQQGLIKQARKEGWVSPAEMLATMSAKRDNNAAKDEAGSNPNSEQGV